MLGYSPSMEEHPQGKYCLYEDVPQWVSVKERLPENGDYSVLCHFSNGSIEDVKIWHVQDFTQPWKDLRITHWMPLPPPPEDSDDD